MSEMMFYLMHRDTVAVAVMIDDISGAITKVSPTANQEILPMGARQSADALRKWWQRRAVPLGQGHIEKLLQYADISTTQSLMVKCLGLSLSDHYWINPISSDLTWADVSLFTNDFRDPIGTAQMSGLVEDADLRGATIFTPGSSLQGQLKKRWIIQDGKRYLVKANLGANSQQSLNEVAATLLHKKQGLSLYTEYSPCMLDSYVGGRIGCMCEDFADENLEFIPAIDVMDSKKKIGDQSYYEHFISVCSENGLAENHVRDFLEYQILTDYLLTNTDRHFGNFGVLRDSSTMKFVSMAPIFDTGNSMFWDDPHLPQHGDMTDIRVHSFRSKERELLRYVRKTDRLDWEKLPTSEELLEIYAQDETITYADSIVTGYQKKIELLQQPSGWEPG